MDLHYDSLNLIANVVSIGGVLGIAFLLWQSMRTNKRLESVIAPKSGIEGHLAMCAQVVECDPDGTCVVDDSGHIVLINKRMEEITGYHRSELYGQGVEILVPDAFKSVHPSHREGFVTGPSSRPMRGLKLRHKRGRELSVGINLNHYVDAGGGFTIAKVRLSDGDPRVSGEACRMSE